MDIILIIALGISGVGVITSMHLSWVKFYNSLFKEVAQKLNLEFKKGNAWNPPGISGSIEAFQVEVKIDTDKNKYPLVVKMTMGMKLPTDISITRESAFTKLQRKMGIKDIETGDERFDEEILLETASGQTLIAFLDVKTRRAIAELAVSSEDFVIKAVEITARHDGMMKINAAALVRLIRAMAVVAQLLSREVSLEERFARNILLDPLPQVRINNVRAMTSHPLLKTRNDDVLEKALDNSSVELQIEAAKHLPEKGMNHLVKVLDTRGNSLKIEVLGDVLRVLKQNNFSACIPVLEKLYRTAREEEFKKVILKTFTVFADAGLHTFLLAELEKDNPELQADIIAALGSCGQVEAVERLLKTGNKTLNPFTRQRVNEAIARIQARLGNVEKGWLSVSQLQDSDGALSMSDPAEAGALSLTEKKQELK